MTTSVSCHDWAFSFHFRFLRHGLYIDLVVQECVLYTRLASNSGMQLPLPPCAGARPHQLGALCICFVAFPQLALV